MYKLKLLNLPSLPVSLDSPFFHHFLDFCQNSIPVSYLSDIIFYPSLSFFFCIPGIIMFTFAGIIFVQDRIHIFLCF